MTKNFLRSIKGILCAAVIVGSNTSLARNGFSNPDRLPIAGDKTAIITVQVFTDFSCPYCARGSKLIDEALKNNKGQIKYVLRNLVLPMWPKSETAAKAFNAVYLQSPTLAYDYQNQLFQNQDEFEKKGEAYLYELADKIKANIDQMKTDMKSNKVAEMIEEDRIVAKALGIEGTPTFIIGKELYVGASSPKEFQKTINRQIKKKIADNKESCTGDGCR